MCVVDVLSQDWLKSKVVGHHCSVRDVEESGQQLRGL
jgi:hypothetical protein